MSMPPDFRPPSLVWLHLLAALTIVLMMLLLSVNYRIADGTTRLVIFFDSTLAAAEARASQRAQERIDSLRALQQRIDSLENISRRDEP